MRDQEQRHSTLWTAAVIGVVVIALALASVSLVLAIFQTKSLARLRVEELHREARLIVENVNNQAVPQLEELLTAVASNVRGNLSADPLRGRWAPTWVDELYIFDATPNLVIWQANQQTGRRNWSRPSGRNRDNDRYQATIIGLLVPSLIAAQFNARFDRVEYAYDVIEDRPLVVAFRVDPWEQSNPTIVGARVNLEQLVSDLVKPRPEVSASRIGVIEVLPGGAAAAQKSHAWTEDLAPLAPFLRLTPTRDFVSRQQGVVRRQALFFVGGTILAIAALLAVIWSMWRVFNREMALSRLKQSFVADVSHELKTPLALIRLFAETLLSDRINSDEKRREYYQVISRESGRLTHLINNILDFARIDSDRKAYSMYPLDVGSLVRQTYEAYQIQLDHEGFEHQLVVADDLPEVFADRDAIAQALINLINNAMKYTDQDDKFLGVDVSAETRRGQHGVLISVSDRGIGIKPEDRNLLFTDFYRSSDERVRRQRGAGLGLALVKHIVDAHGGIVDVESRLVKGSTFRIFLPENKPVITAEDASHVQNPAG